MQISHLIHVEQHIMYSNPGIDLENYLFQRQTISLFEMYTSENSDFTFSIILAFKLSIRHASTLKFDGDVRSGICTLRSCQ